MEIIELDTLPGYPLKKTAPIEIDENGNHIQTMYYPIPELDLVSDNQITIMDTNFKGLTSVLSNQILHYVYGPVQLIQKNMRGDSLPRLFFKNPVTNNRILQKSYNSPFTVFTHDGYGIDTSITNQLVFKRQHLIDMHHPYYGILNKILEHEPKTNDWPWATLEITIDCVRPGDLILGQIQLFEIDLDIRYYIEVEDVSPFTAYCLTR